MRKTRGGWGETPPPFPSRARLIFALLVLIRSHYTLWEPDRRTYLILWTWRSCNTNLVTYYPMLGAVRKNVARRTTHSENEAFRARGAVIRPQSLSSGVLFSGSFDNTLEWNLSFGTLPLFRDSFIQGTHDLVPEKFLLLIFTWPH